MVSASINATPPTVDASGQVTIGASLSFTVIVVVQVAVFSPTSTIVQTIVLTPFGKSPLGSPDPLTGSHPDSEL